MKSILHHPALVLAVLGAASGVLGTFALGFGYGEAPQLGAHMVLTGLWFGGVIGFGVWRWGTPSWVAVATALAATWIAWETAVNLAMQLEENWLKVAAVTDPMRSYIAGFAAGAVGAFLTWAGAAAFTRGLRQVSTAAAVVGTGALFGLLLPWTNYYDMPVVLLVPWQTAVAAVLGFCLASQQVSPPRAPSILAQAHVTD